MSTIFFELGVIYAKFFLILSLTLLGLTTICILLLFFGFFKEEYRIAAYIAGILVTINVLANAILYPITYLDGDFVFQQGHIFSFGAMSICHFFVALTFIVYSFKKDTEPILFGLGFIMLILGSFFSAFLQDNLISDLELITIAGLFMLFYAI